MLDFLIANRADLQALLLVLTVLAAFRWGAGPERASAATLLFMLLADKLYHLMFGAGAELARMDVGHAIIDATACVAFVAIGTRANRMYTLWLAAFQIIATTVHLSRDLAISMSPFVYAVMYIAPSYFQIALIAGGLWLHRRRLRRFGTYKSWRRSSSPSFRIGRGPSQRR